MTQEEKNFIKDCCAKIISETAKEAEGFEADEILKPIVASFSYTDEQLNSTFLSKSVGYGYMGKRGELGPLCELFKEFLLAAGFTYLHDKKVEWVLEDD